MKSHSFRQGRINENKLELIHHSSQCVTLEPWLLITLNATDQQRRCIHLNTVKSSTRS